ncbi:MAG TPA: inorganic phosphate transporter [Gaiellaceae bacterium]|nr:inorganic phosphate transporter [Gaiellaceae bacterium]
MRELGLVSVPCAFGVVSGFNDGGNLLASFTAGRVIAPRAAWALLLLSVLGPLVVGTQVARTVGLNVVDLPAQGTVGFVAITAAALGVVLGSWRLRLPTSMTLALVGAMIGWTLVDAGHSPIRWRGAARALAATPLSILIGLASAFVFYRAARRLLARQPYARVLSLARYQYVTSALQAVAYGSNDMEKTMGLVVVAEVLAQTGAAPRFDAWLPLLLAFSSFALGALLGGWRIARRVGAGVFRVRSVQAMTEQLGAGVAVAALSFAGAPVSSTQTIGGSLIGVGVGTRASAVRWGVVREMLASWLITLPLALAAALLVHLLVRGAFGAG